MQLTGISIASLASNELLKQGTALPEPIIAETKDTGKSLYKSLRITPEDQQCPFQTIKATFDPHDCRNSNAVENFLTVSAHNVQCPKQLSKSGTGARLATPVGYYGT